MPLADEKNPMHPSALRLRDLTVGRHIVSFNKEFGIMGEYIIVSRPFVDDSPLGRTIKIWLRNIGSGIAWVHYTNDMGVTTYPGRRLCGENWWSRTNYFVDHRKRHLLPAPTPSPYEYYYDELDEEEEIELETLSRTLAGLRML